MDLSGIRRIRSAHAVRLLATVTTGAALAVGAAGCGGGGRIDRHDGLAAVHGADDRLDNAGACEDAELQQVRDDLDDVDDLQLRQLVPRNVGNEHERRRRASLEHETPATSTPTTTPTSTSSNGGGGL